MNEATKPLLDHDPCPNVIETEEFHNRVATIFKQVGEILARSAGPCGAPAIISQYPFHHITKDGYTIRKNISYEKSDGFLDQVISDLCGNICDRLNYTVGDGTTAAILVTCAMYDRYMQKRDLFDKFFLRPADIIKTLRNVTPKVIDILESNSHQISSLDHDDMVRAIKNIVMISSNSDEELTNIIGNIYDKIGFPAITVEMSDDGKMRSEIYEGYLANIVLTDSLYVNNDNMTMDEKDCDVMIYDHKINLATYEKTLRPLSNLCRQRGRKLLVMAPYFDQTALGIISEDLNKERRATGTVNLVLMNYRNTGWLAAKKISDLAMLCQTTLINSTMDAMLNQEMDNALNSADIAKLPVCLDGRHIPGINVAMSISRMTTKDGTPIPEQTMVKWDENIPDESLVLQETERSFRIGYIGSVSAGLKKSIFKDFIINKDLYNLYLKEAEEDLNETIKKYSNLGGFNVEVNQKQDRLMSLHMKMGTIYVGADTDFSRNFVKDVVDDCVRAAESAFRNGYVKGCHVSILRAIDELRSQLANDYANNRREILVLTVLLESYTDVYKTILTNGSRKAPEVLKNNTSYDDILDMFEKTFMCRPNLDKTKVDDVLYSCINIVSDSGHTFFDFIVWYSMITDRVFDFNFMEFTPAVINSTATDREILKSAIDLIGLLITGNQLIISRPK